MCGQNDNITNGRKVGNGYGQNDNMLFFKNK